MKRNRITSRFSPLMIAALLLIAGFLQAQNTKDYNKEETLKAGDVVSIDVAHSDLEINTWDKDLVKLSIHVEVDASSKDDAARMLELFDYEIKRTSNGISVNLDAFHDKIRNMNSNNNVTTVTLKNGDKLKFNDLDVEIEVFTSKNHDLELNGRFSDISLGEMKSKAELELNSSSLKGNNIGELNLDASFSEVLLNDVGSANMDINSSEVTLNDINTLSCEAKFSEIEISTVKELNIDTQSGEFEIQAADRIKGEAQFTQLEIGTLNQSLEMEAQSSEIEINEIGAQFSSIDLECDFSTIEIEMKNRSYQLDLETNFSDVETSEGELEASDEFGTQINYDGVIGDDKSTSLTVKLKCDSCGIDLD